MLGYQHSWDAKKIKMFSNSLLTKVKNCKFFKFQVHKKKENLFVLPKVNCLEVFSRLLHIVLRQHLKPK